MPRRIAQWPASDQGPQYVCTSFSTFICTNCSGIHREFSHRVKSVSMAKFTSQEVSALQEGGNERAKEIYFKYWDLQGPVIDSRECSSYHCAIALGQPDHGYTGTSCLLIPLQTSEIYRQKLQQFVADGELSKKEVEALMAFQVHLCIPQETVDAAHTEICGQLFEKVLDSSQKLLPPDELRKRFEQEAAVSALGIYNKDGIVVYDGKGLFSAARVWW
ncbi:putative ADP-ribosylation factor GTPase-activating protein AGD14 [Zea mays]|uniref:Putative ADP-ribosylation factor GTPase-activating protein AGD14 n=1 Tax=Zea mays TaxID=4577 RepID=A0A3L6G056_MAIZE|nr:putative ADP-ribosylation factor GTPase-activating protein AGD14 [Zea mays]